jgi:branched-chain amino acid transport system substrate-binding protein
MVRGVAIRHPGSARRWWSVGPGRPTVAILAAVLLIGAGFAQSANGSLETAAGAPGVTATTITLGIETSFTGPVAAAFGDSPLGFYARIALQNAEGGVDGRQLKIVKGDDQGTPAGAQAAAQTLVEQDHVFALATLGILAFAAEPFLLKEKVPVVGSPIDGNEWTPPNNNMIPTFGSPSPHYPAAASFGEFFRRQGVTRLAIVGVPLPSSVLFAKNMEASAKAAGIQLSYVNNTIPVTQEGNFQNIVQQMKSDHVDGIFFDLEVGAAFEILEAAVQAGIHFKADLDSAQPSAAIFQNPEAQAAGQGNWTQFPYVPPSHNIRAVKVFEAALAKYEHQTTPPDRHEYDGWIAADILIAGLKLAGPNPTQATVLTKLRADNHYTAGGLEISPISFSRSFGTGAANAAPSPGDCTYFMQYRGTSWIAQPKPICAGLVPNSSAA